MNNIDLISDLTCALPRSAWTDADADLYLPIAPRPAGGWRVLDYRCSHYNGRLLHAFYQSGRTRPQEMEMLEVGGISLEAFSRLLGF